jgi:hypothetical protein
MELVGTICNVVTAASAAGGFILALVPFLKKTL